MPELSDFIKSIFLKKYIKEHNMVYLSSYLIESCRAELTHRNIIILSFLFSLWNSSLTAVIMTVIAVILNLPYIIIQRYNGPRIIRVLKQLEYSYSA